MSRVRLVAVGCVVVAGLVSAGLPEGRAQAQGSTRQGGPGPLPVPVVREPSPHRPGGVAVPVGDQVMPDDSTPKHRGSELMRFRPGLTIPAAPLELVA